MAEAGRPGDRVVLAAGARVPVRGKHSVQAVGAVRRTAGRLGGSRGRRPPRYPAARQGACCPREVAAVGGNSDRDASRGFLTAPVSCPADPASGARAGAGSPVRADQSSGSTSVQVSPGAMLTARSASTTRIGDSSESGTRISSCPLRRRTPMPQ